MIKEGKVVAAQNEGVEGVLQALRIAGAVQVLKQKENHTNAMLESPVAGFVL